MITERLSNPEHEPFPASTVEKWCGAGIKTVGGAVATDDADILADLQTDGRSWCEDILGRALVITTFRVTYDWADLLYPDGTTRRTLWLPMPPLVSIDAVNWTDDDGTVTAITTADYWAHTGDYGRIALKTDSNWPTSTPREHACLAIDFTAGYMVRDDISQASTDSETLVTGSEVNLASGKRLSVYVAAATKGITVTVYGSALATFVVDTMVIAAAANHEYVTASAGYAYYRVKVKSTVAANPGTASVETRLGSLPSYVSTALKEYCRFYYRNRGDGIVTNSKSGGNVALPDHMRRVAEMLRLHAVAVVG
jgi:hypothetical protein